MIYQLSALESQNLFKKKKTRKSKTFRGELVPVGPWKDFWGDDMSLGNLEPG